MLIRGGGWGKGGEWGGGRGCFLKKKLNGGTLNREPRVGTSHLIGFA